MGYQSGRLSVERKTRQDQKPWILFGGVIAFHMDVEGVPRIECRHEPIDMLELVTLLYRNDVSLMSQYRCGNVRLPRASIEMGIDVS